MKKILIISYYYPPISDVGSLRSIGFKKYLPDNGWKPVILSVKNPDKQWCKIDSKYQKKEDDYYVYSIINLTKISGLLNGFISRISKKIPININFPSVMDIFCIPDQFIGWIPLTIIVGYKLIKKNNIDLIYVSCKPFSAAISGFILKKLTKKKLVIEYRDPVSLSPSFMALNKKLPRIIFTKIIENYLLNKIDKLIFVSKETNDLYLDKFPFLSGKTNIVHNGFYEEYFRDVSYSLHKKRDGFTIIYTGNFYERYLDPEPFFIALNRVLKLDYSIKKDLKFIYVGSKRTWIQNLIEKYDLNENTVLTGYVNRKESIEYLIKSNVLLLRIVPGMISTKLYEALAIGIPILALIEEGEVERIIKKYSLAKNYICSPNDIENISKSIFNAYELWKKGEMINIINERYYKDFGKKHLTFKLSGLLNSLT